MRKSGAAYFRGACGIISIWTRRSRQWLEGVVRVLVAEKDWVGGGEFELTDEMKVAIAAYAGVMTLGLPEPYYFDRLMTIIVYPGTYQPRESV